MRKIKLRNIVQNFGFLLNWHKPDNKPNVLIFSIPRSGSTWLQELVWSQSGFKYVNEPLNLKSKWLQKKSGINGFKELYSQDVKTKLLNYFKAFSDGKNHFMNPNPLRKNTRFITKRIVFKVIHGGEAYINDIARETDSKIVFLIRNPIAVSLSRKQLPRTEELTSNFVLSSFTKEEQKYAKDIMKNGDEMEKRIMAWCIQNKFALMHRTNNWFITSYEELTCYPDKVIPALAAHCELSEIERMMQGVHIPSAVSTQSESDSVKLMSDKGDKRKILISKWRDKVSELEMQRYFEICEMMNFDIYKASSDFPFLDDFL